MKMQIIIPLIIFTLTLFNGCRSKSPQPHHVSSTQTGIASYYGSQWHGRQTASGERMDVHALTAAHRTLPFGTKVRVTLLSTGRSVIVRINDRGPFVSGRIIDLADEAARRIGLMERGIGQVRVEVLDQPQILK